MQELVADRPLKVNVKEQFTHSVCDITSRYYFSQGGGIFQSLKDSYSLPLCRIDLCVTFVRIRNKPIHILQLKQSYNLGKTTKFNIMFLGLKYEMRFGRKKNVFQIKFHSWEQVPIFINRRINDLDNHLQIQGLAQGIATDNRQ